MRLVAPSSARIEDLATLPVFLKLRGKPVLVAGGDKPAVWKVELLAAAGAEVRVYAAVPCDEMLALAEALPRGSVTLVPSEWSEADLAGAAVAIGSLPEDSAADFSRAARAAGVPVNVIDKPEFCDFQFGTVVARSPLVIGISTDGGAPVFGQALRTRIEALLPQELRSWAKAAKGWRDAVAARGLDFRQRRSFWETFAARALAADTREPTLDDQAACFAAADGSGVRQGRITLVGAGSGRLGSLTLDAVGALQSADQVLFGPGVPQAIVNFARRESLKTSVSSLEQGCGEAARVMSGRAYVVLLGMGDPATDATWSAVVERLKGSGIAPAIVPALR